MADVEIPHAHEVDALGKKVGIGVAFIGILLSVATIASHREHTAAVVFKTEANDRWAFYQAKKIRESQSGVSATLLTALGTDQAKTAAGITALNAERDRYGREAAEIQKSAEEKEGETKLAEVKALRFDLGEGLLELGLVLSSLYFLARNVLFPVAGATAAVLGTALAASALLV